MLNKREFDYLRITEYHNAGFRGQGLRVAVFDEDFTLPDGWCNAVGVLGYGNGPPSSHGAKTVNILHQILPEAKIFLMPDTGESLQWCLDNDIDIINASVWAPPLGNFKELNKQAAEKIILVAASGNMADRMPIYCPARLPEWIAVGAVVLRNGELIPADYSSEGPELDVAGLTSLEVVTPTTPPGFKVVYGGTSCASPVVAGMLGLLLQREPFSPQEARAKLKQYSVDIGPAGWDSKTGVGLFRLPALAEDEQRDTPEERLSYYKLWIGKGTMLDMETGEEIPVIPPILHKEKTMVHVRVLERAGYPVRWIHEEKAVLIRKPERV